MTTLSKADQQTLVGDGLAIGCLDIGITGLTAKKTELELSFNHAWRNFPLASTVFRQVHGDIERTDILAIFHKSPRRRSGRVTWEQNGPWWEFDLDVEDVEDVAGVISDVYGVGRDAWTTFTRSLAERLGEENIRRG